MRYHRFNMVELDGTKRILLANLTVIQDSEHQTHGALISLRLDNEDELLRREREKQEAILGSLAEGLFTVDNEWRITSFNRAAERMTGWAEHEVLGKYCQDIFGHRDCVDNCPLAETLKLRKPIIDFEMELCPRHGEKRLVNVNTAILYHNGGEAVGGVISFRDCSSLKEIDAKNSMGSDFHGIVGKNVRMREIYRMIQETASSKATVLILGESGTGKELVAAAIMELSPRRNLPYVRVNCAAIPDTLLESELFGHKKGAFTDAKEDRTGRFELADSGTIFLDEVGDLTPSAQMKLLRVLEEGEFQRLGSSTTVKVDVRVIAATNRDLLLMVQKGEFRDDLYYRLNVIQLKLPPLRERRDDLIHLIQHFMAKFRRETGKGITEISDKAYNLLSMHDYPGNVRELENIIEHAFVRTQGNIITENKLPAYVSRIPLSEQENSIPAPDLMGERLEILQVLEECQWNRQAAAKRLGVSRTTLWRRMRELDYLANASPDSA